MGRLAISILVGGAILAAGIALVQVSKVLGSAVVVLGMLAIAAWFLA